MMIITFKKLQTLLVKLNATTVKTYRVEKNVNGYSIMMRIGDDWTKNVFGLDHDHCFNAREMYYFILGLMAGFNGEEL